MRGKARTRETARPYSMTDLVNMRRFVRRTWDGCEGPSENGRILRNLLEAVNASIKELVNAPETETTNKAFREIWESYQTDNSLALENPAVQAAQDGRLDDVDKAVVDDLGGPESVRALKQIMGESWWNNYYYHSRARRRRIEYAMRRQSGVVWLKPPPPTPLPTLREHFTRLREHFKEAGRRAKEALEGGFYILLALLIVVGLPTLLVWVVAPTQSDTRCFTEPCIGLVSAM